jgi:hypothetical protein
MRAIAALMRRFVMRWVFVLVVLVLAVQSPAVCAATSFGDEGQWLDRGLDRDDVLLLGGPRRRVGNRRAPVALSLASFVTAHHSGLGAAESQSTGWGFAVTVSLPTSLAGPPRERAPPLAGVALPKGLARRCVRAAWDAAGVGNDKKLDGMATRARLSAALPEVRLRASRGIDAQARVDTDYDTERFADTSSTNVWLEARLTWRLDRAVFADEEIQVERLLHDRRELRLRIANKVLEAVSRWLQAKSALVNIVDHETRVAAVVRIEDTEATLDALTDGWFGAANMSGQHH